MIRILIAEDQGMVRGALAALLAFEPDFEVVAQVGCGDDVVAAALATRPDVALLDIEMPGIRCDREGRRAQPHRGLARRARSRVAVMEDRGEQQTASGADVSDLVPLVHVADTGGDMRVPRGVVIRARATGSTSRVAWRRDTRVSEARRRPPPRGPSPPAGRPPCPS